MEVEVEKKLSWSLNEGEEEVAIYVEKETGRELVGFLNYDQMQALLKAWEER